jgi:hypothetical protein
VGDEGAFLDHPILASSFYPLAVWDRFLAVARRELRQKTGETELQFDMRNMRQAGSVIIRTVYKFVLGIMSAKGVLEKVPGIYTRCYNEGRCEVVENTPGRAVLRFCDCSPAFRENLSHHFPTGTVFLLELNGVKNIDARISRDEVVDGRLLFEITLTYTP